jgi:hypothetical protein
MRSSVLISLILLLCCPAWMPAQESSLALKPNQVARVYVEGAIEDFNYLRRSVTYVDFVNDPKLADIQVIATALQLGAGGYKYYLNFYSGPGRDQSDFRLAFIHNPGDTDDTDRVRFRKTLEIGLLHYLSETNTIDSMSIGYEAASGKPITKKQSETDPWNSWVFRATTTGGLDLEESKTSYSFSGSIQADRLTDTWLIRNYLSYQYSTRTYRKSEDEIYKSVNQVEYLSSRVAYALNKHLSAGIYLYQNSSTYINTDFLLSAKPAIEYNFFDWKDADHKIFTIGYCLGPAYYNYRDTTFRNKMEDRLLEHDLSHELEIVKPWGEIQAAIEYEGYLSDLRNFNLSAEADFSVRISKGLAVNLELYAESVHNQLYLPKEEVSLEELLLNSRKLPTSFQLGAEIGLRFYFGSIYNNVVNERL